MNKELSLWALYIIVFLLQAGVAWRLSRGISRNVVVRVFLLLVSTYAVSLILLGMNLLPTYVAYICVITMNVAALGGAIAIPLILLLVLLWFIVPAFRKYIGNLFHAGKR